MSSTEILKWFMVVAFFVLIITNLSAAAESESDKNYKKNHAAHVKAVQIKTVNGKNSN